MSNTKLSFEELMDRHFDGGLTAEDTELLSQLLQQDPERARQFSMAAAMHHQIRSLLTLDRIVAAPTDFESNVDGQSMPLVVDPKGDGLSLASILRFRLSSWSMFAVAAVLATIGATVLPALFSEQKEQPSPQKVVRLEHGRVNSVRLESGVTTLVLDRIGTVTIEGPSDFTLIDPMRARLTHGRIKFRVTEVTGRGFVVETPYGNVTDLGTEFALDVPKTGKAGLVVFDGAVDLEIEGSQESGSATRKERLVRGEGVSFNTEGQLGRIMSIVTGNAATFTSGNDIGGGPDQIIVNVADNIRSPGFKKFYEIVPAGLREDALAFVEWPLHDWNGVTEDGMPEYLVGADYVKPFDTDKLRNDLEIFLTVATPARLFVFFDKRVSPPDWLKSEFRDTGDVIGLDAGEFVRDGIRCFFPHDEGPGKSIDAVFSVWEKVVEQPGMVQLGPNAAKTDHSSMYGIAAIRLDQPASQLDRATSKVERSSSDRR